MTAANPFQFKNYHPRPLEIIDTTLREGSQTSLLHDHYKYFFTQNDKMEIVRALIVYGVKFIELFGPIVSPQERDDFAAVKSVRDELIMQKGYTFLLAHVRCHADDVASAIEAGADGLNFYIGLSETSRLYNHGQELDDIIRHARALLEEVRRHHPDLILRFSGEDAFRTPEAHLFRVYDQVIPFVDRLGTPDTVGVATPTAIAQRLRALRQRYPQMEFEGHFHDDRGFALINSLEAIRSSMTGYSTSVISTAPKTCWLVPT
jgi:homocitrate synthase